MLQKFSQTAFFLLLWSFSGALRAQEACVFMRIIPQTVQFATEDHLSNAYLVNGSEIEKLDSTGRLAARYSNNRLGRMGFLDATNPLKILVWYPDFLTAVFLDRNMTELGRLNLSEAGYPAVRCVASSTDGNLWAYDEASSSLMKLTTSGEKLLGSQPLNQEFRQGFSPTCIRDDGGQHVFLSDPRQGLAVFDPFVQLDKTLDFKGLVQFEVKNGLLYFLESGSIRVEHFQGFSSKKIPLPWTEQAGVTGFWMSKGRLFAQTPFGLSEYGF